MLPGAGGYFDPLGLASDGSDRAFKLKTAEIKHGRLAMVAFLGALTNIYRSILGIQSQTKQILLLLWCLCKPWRSCRPAIDRVLAVAGFGVQALTQGEGALGSLAKFANTFAPELVEDVEKAIGQ